MTERRFRLALGLILALAAVARILYTVLLAPWPPHAFDDELYFFTQAHLIADGHGFASPLQFFQGHVRPGAMHPPLYPLLLAGAVKLGAGQLALRLLGTITGVGTLLIVAVLARRLGGNRVALIAAGLGACYPILITADGALMSESLFGLLVAATLLAGQRLLARPTAGNAVLFGVSCGVAALTRGEALLLLVLLLIPLMRGRRGLALTAAAVLATLVVLAPWTIRNLDAFGRPVLISTDFSSAVAGANCYSTYYGGRIGDWDLTCIRLRAGNEAQLLDGGRTDALNYATAHVTRLPIVAAARLLRAWGIGGGFPFGTSAPHLEGRQPAVLAAGYLVYLLLAALAIYGIVLARRGALATWLLLTPVVLVSISALLIYGNVRFRQPAEITILLFSALALETVRGKRATIASATP